MERPWPLLRPPFQPHHSSYFSISRWNARQAFQKLPLEKGKGAVRLVLDTLDGQRADYTEIEVAQNKLSHRVRELARVACGSAKPEST
jgi:hypothetical protein